MTQAVAMNTSKKFLSTGEVLFSDYPFKVADLSEATVAFGRKEIELAEHEMPGLDGTSRRVQRQAPSQGRTHHGLAAHDHSNRSSY